MQKKSNIILVGMPGAGKSTIGPALAGRLNLDFLDTDAAVSEMAGSELKEYVARFGKESFLELQENTILSLNLHGTVIATGGSVGCSPVLMEHLKQNGIAVYLKVEFDVVEQRLAPGRKLARDGGMTLEDLYRQRTPLYEANAELVAECTNRPVEEIVEEIIKCLDLMVRND